LPPILKHAHAGSASSARANVNGGHVVAEIGKILAASDHLDIAALFKQSEPAEVNEQSEVNLPPSFQAPTDPAPCRSGIRAAGR
jgi:hypothetical protein